MAEVAEGGNKFLLELKNALRKLNRTRDENDGLEKGEGVNSSCTSDTLTPGDTTCTYSLNDATMSSTLTLHGDVITETDKLANEKSGSPKPLDPKSHVNQCDKVAAADPKSPVKLCEKVGHPDPKSLVNRCDQKSVPYVAVYVSKIAQKGIAEAKHAQQNGRLPGIHLLNENNKSVPSGLKVQVSDVETSEGSNASSPKTLSTVYSSDKESTTVQRQRSDPKTPSASRPIPESESTCISQRPPRARNMKLAQVDLYNELNSVLKKRNQMTRRSSIMELEKQRGCKTIVYYGRGGASSGQLNRKGSITSSSPSPMAATRTRTYSIADSVASDCGIPAVESPLPPAGNTQSIQHKKAALNRTELPVLNKCDSKYQNVESSTKLDTRHRDSTEPELPWVPPPTIGPDGGKTIALNQDSSGIHTTNDKLTNEARKNERYPLIQLPLVLKDDFINMNCVNQAPGPSKLIADLTQTQFCAEEHVTNSEPSEADSVVSKELIDLRKAFDTVDSKNIRPRSPTVVVGSHELTVTNGDQSASSSEPKITVEIQWPKDPPPTYLHEELRRWHARLSGKWKNQDEEDVMDDRTTCYSDDEAGHLDGGLMPDRDHPSGASHSSVEGTRTASPRLQLPRATLSPSTRQRLRDIKQNAATMLFNKAEEHSRITPNVDNPKTDEAFESNLEDSSQKQFREINTEEEEEKESSIDFAAEEVHPGNLVSQLVDKVRSSNVQTHTTARVQCDDSKVGQTSDASSDPSEEGSSLLSGSEYHGTSHQPRAPNTHAHVTNLQVVTSDMSLTSVTSFDVSSGDLRSDRYEGLGRCSNETLTFSSGADMRYTSGSSINQNPRSWDQATSKDSIADSRGAFVKSQNNVRKPPRSKLCSTLEENDNVSFQTYAGSSTLEGQKQFTQAERTVFVKVIPTTFTRQPSRGFADEKVKSLDRMLVRKCKNIVHCTSHVDTENSDQASDGSNGYTNYATYPPPSRPFPPADDGDKTLTNLMITHSGEPLPPPGRATLEDNGKPMVDNRHNCISANVTVPQPTSFHTHGNNVGGHLINPHHTRSKHEIHLDSDGFRVSSSCTDYESGAENADNIIYPCGRLINTGNDSESGEESSHHFQKKHVTVLDKESQRHLLFQTWSSNAAARKARDRTRLPHWRRGAKSMYPGDDSDSSVGHRHSVYDRGGRRHHHSDHKLSDSRGSSRSVVKSKLLRHAESFSSCDAPCGEMGIYYQKRERTFSGTDSVHSACTYVVDSQQHSSDGDTESLYQDYSQYEQTLIQYVRTEDLSQINEDIRSLYWQQFDSMSLAGLPGHHKGILHRLVCCFFCEHNHRPTYPDRATSRASSSKFPSVLGSSNL